MSKDIKIATTKATRDRPHRKESRTDRLAKLDAAIKRGLADADAGRTRSVEAARIALKRLP